MKIVLFNILFLLVLTVTTTTNGQSEYRVPTWGVKVGEEYEFKLETCRINGTTENANYLIYPVIRYGGIESTYLTAVEGDSWKFKIVEVNDTGLFGTIELKENKTRVIELDYFAPFFLDTHADNKSYWQEQVDFIKENPEKMNGELQEINLNGTRLTMKTMEDYNGIITEMGIEFDIEKGVTVVYEINTYSNNSLSSRHLKFVCSTLTNDGFFNYGNLDLSLIVASGIVIFSVVSVGVVGGWLLTSKLPQGRGLINRKKLTSYNGKGTHNSSRLVENPNISRETVQNALSTITEIQRELNAKKTS